MPSRTRAIVDEALALRASHPHAPAVDILDLAIKGRDAWLEDFFEHMVPPSPFALLVAEAVDDFSPRAMAVAHWPECRREGARSDAAELCRDGAAEVPEALRAAVAAEG